MRTINTLLLSLLCAVLGSCVTYHGVAKVNDTVYLTGTEGFFIFSESWVKRCVETGQTLLCDELAVTTNPPKPVVKSQSPKSGEETFSEADESPPEQPVSPAAVPNLPPEATCIEITEWLCNCNTPNQPARNIYCERARQFVGQTTIDEKSCVGIVKGMFPLARCLP